MLTEVGGDAINTIVNQSKNRNYIKTSISVNSMRGAEHLFHGFFGAKKKKQDSIKYYDERVQKMKGIDEKLDMGIEEFRKILANHKKKLEAYDMFLQKLDTASWHTVKAEIHKLEGMFDEDELSNEKEKKYIISITETIQKFLEVEDSDDIDMTEKEVLEDLRALRDVIEGVGPLWEMQLKFIEKNDQEILTDKNNIKILSDIFKEESDVLRMEETLLRKIDLKTGIILRKTSLKLRDLEDTKDLGVQYREIKYIR